MGKEGLDGDDEVLDPEQDEFEDEPLEPIQPDIERQARQLGWHPKEEYRGPQGRWVDAEEFVRRGETILPVMRDNNRRMMEKLDRNNDEMAELRRTITQQAEALGELRTMARTANDRGYQAALADLKKRQREAAASGDVESFDQISEQIETAVSAREPTAPIPKKDDPPPPSQTVPKEVLDFVSQNTWYNTDRELNLAMNKAHEFLLATENTLTLSENLERALDMVKDKFPSKFPGNRGNGHQPALRRGSAPVSQPSGGGRGSDQNRKDPNSLNSIEDPEERVIARRAYEKLKNAIQDYTEAEYMEVYNNPRADVISVRRQAKEKARAR